MTKDGASGQFLHVSASTDHTIEPGVQGSEKIENRNVQNKSCTTMASTDCILYRFLVRVLFACGINKGVN